MKPWQHKKFQNHSGLKTEETNRLYDVTITTKYHFELFVVKDSDVSLRAIKNLQGLIKKQLDNTFTLDIIDIYQQPEKAFVNKIIAIPTLIRKKPKPEIRVTGDLTDEKLLTQILII